MHLRIIVSFFDVPSAAKFAADFFHGQKPASSAVRLILCKKLFTSPKESQMTAESFTQRVMDAEKTLCRVAYGMLYNRHG